MKNFLILLLMFVISSCGASAYKQEAIKSGKAAAASQRINSTQENSKDVFKDIE
jgi:hypothetical protein